MSLQDKKSTLFGKGGGSGATDSSRTVPSKPLFPLSSTPTIIAATSQLSKESRQRKLDEARFFCEKANELIKTNVFKWSADHLAAAPQFEKAALAYVSVGESELAKEMYLKAADSQQKYDAYSAAAFTLMKAAQTALSLGQYDEATEIYERASMSWALDGQLDKAGDSLIKAGKAVEDHDSRRAWVIFQRAVELLFPHDTPRDKLVSIPAITMDALRDILRFLLKSRMIKEALVLVPRMITLYQTQPTDYLLDCCSCVTAIPSVRLICVWQGYESMMCKAMLTLTLLQLETGDVVLADQTFLQEHLSVSLYLRSSECKCAESFINAFKSMDPTALEEAQKAQEVSFLDSEVQQLARGLSLMASKRSEKSDRRAAGPSPAPSISVATAMPTIPPPPSYRAPPPPQATAAPAAAAEPPAVLPLAPQLPGDRSDAEANLVAGIACIGLDSNIVVGDTSNNNSSNSSHSSGIPPPPPAPTNNNITYDNDFDDDEIDLT